GSADKLDGDDSTGAKMVARALEEPLKQIAVNAGYEGGVVVEKVRSLSGSEGLNAATGDYEDLVKAGVIDAAKVTRSALQNAASIAALFLTTEAVVADKPEEKPAMPAGGGMPRGMDGMGGFCARTPAHDRSTRGAPAGAPHWRGGSLAARHGGFADRARRAGACDGAKEKNGAVGAVGGLGRRPSLLQGRSRPRRGRAGRHEARARRDRVPRGRRPPSPRVHRARAQGRARDHGARARCCPPSAVPARAGGGAAPARVVVRITHRAFGVHGRRGARPRPSLSRTPTEAGDLLLPDVEATRSRRQLVRAALRPAQATHGRARARGTRVR